MKKLFVPKIEIPSNADIQYISEKLKETNTEDIACLNWADKYPYKPDVHFHIAHNNKAIFLQYGVQEKEIRATVTEDNGRVWTDSCVEFFLSFDKGSHYYNAEFSCIGKALLGYRQSGDQAIHAPTNIMESIERLSSLGVETITKQLGDYKWTLTLVIPLTAFWKSNIQHLSGQSIMGNFYKCGDDLTTPHFISWAPISTDKPSFHQPHYFGEIIFE